MHFKNKTKKFITYFENLTDENMNELMDSIESS